LNLPGLEALIDNVTFLVASVSSQKPKGYKTYNYFVAKWLGWYMAVNTMRVLHAYSYCQTKSVSQCHIVLGCA